MRTARADFLRGKLCYAGAGLLVLMIGLPFVLEKGMDSSWELAWRSYLVGLLALTVYEARRLSLIFVTVCAFFSILGESQEWFAHGVSREFPFGLLVNLSLLALLYGGKAARYYATIRPRWAKIDRLRKAEGRL